MGANRSQTSRKRLTVAQASEILGVTVEAVRDRIKRGTLEHERHSGTVYVLLSADQVPSGQQPGDDQTTDQERPDAHEELADELRDQNPLARAPGRGGARSTPQSRYVACPAYAAHPAARRRPQSLVNSLRAPVLVRVPLRPPQTLGRLRRARRRKNLRRAPFGIGLQVPLAKRSGLPCGSPETRLHDPQAF